MRVIIRTDSSIEMGAGHLMRCLTLAEALRKKGATCHFICRNHPGNLSDLVKSRGFRLSLLPPPDGPIDNVLKHSSWLGSTQIQDAILCQNIIGNTTQDLIVVDHYGIDHIWEKEMRDCSKMLFVIDDLADRHHECDILLDQNLGSSKEKYTSLTSKKSILLLGPKFSLLRPEFRKWRKYSLKRRSEKKKKLNITISLGGTDPENISEKILKKIQKIKKIKKINIILGANSPHIEKLKNKKIKKTKILTGISNMAEILAKSDLAIGASGSSSWERCSLGVPSIIVTLADNQQNVAKYLSKHKAAIFCRTPDKIDKEINNIDTEKLTSLSAMSAKITKGNGCRIVVKKILETLK